LNWNQNKKDKKDKEDKEDKKVKGNNQMKSKATQSEAQEVVVVVVSNL
jgi:hypothetical protein